MKYIGAHVSVAGGVENAPLAAAAIGARAFAMFTKNQRQWKSPPLREESVRAFRDNCRSCGFSPEHVLPHDGYLINLGQPDDDKRLVSRNAFIDEMQRCARLGLDRLNFHPGSHLRLIDERRCLEHIASGVRDAVDAVPGIMAVVENTAGQGSNTGYSFEQLAFLLELIDRPGRVGVCLDTCHAFAAGYDLLTDDGYEQAMSRFGRLIGFDHLAGVHLNDAKGGIGGRLDRHENLGKGSLGWDVFRRIMGDSRLDNVPMILETPDDSLWAHEIATLYAMPGAR